MGYCDFKELFGHICEIKAFVLQLSVNDLKNYKLIFYNQRVQQWRLDLMWEYIWGDKDYETMELVFKRAKLI